MSNTMFNRNSATFVDGSARSTIEPEELLADQVRVRRIDVLEARIEQPLGKFHLWLLFALICAILLTFAARLWYVTVMQGPVYQALAQETRSQTEWSHAPRGVIFDTNGTQLIFNDPIFSVIAIPALLPKHQAQLDDIMRRLTPLLNIELPELAQQFLDMPLVSFRPYPLADHISRETALAIESQFADQEGIAVKEQFIRRYEYGSLLAHVLGYVGRVAANDLKLNDSYLPIDQIGKSGIELTYEDLLRGSHGKREIEISSIGEKQKETVTTEPIPGSNLTLTIDLSLQQQLTDALRNALSQAGLTRAAAIAMDPRDGAIKALVSFPAYDDNIFSQPLGNTPYQKLLSNKDMPFFNRVVGGQYPPGSTIKPVVAIAALADHIIEPLKQIFVTGSISVPSIYNPSIQYVFRDWKEHGWVDMREALAVSSNVYFYTVGGGFGDIKGLGIDRLEHYWRLFGLGSTLGIDLPGEQAGNLPSPSWKQAVKDEQWYIGDTYNASIGQGDVIVTPLQIAEYTSAIAKGGVLYKPHVVQSISNMSGETTVSVNPVVITNLNGIASPESFKVVQEGMRRGVTSGSSRLLNSLPIAVAGKTCTAQVGGTQQPHAWFTGFAPYNDPQLVLTILIENGGEGSQVAVPVAHDVFLWYATQTK